MSLGFNTRGVVSLTGDAGEKSSCFSEGLLMSCMLSILFISRSSFSGWLGWFLFFGVFTYLNRSHMTTVLFLMENHKQEHLFESH